MWRLYVVEFAARFLGFRSELQFGSRDLGGCIACKLVNPIVFILIKWGGLVSAPF